MMVDRLSLANALAEANIPRPAAERIATEIYDAIHENVATKADIQRLEDTTKTDFQHLEDGLDARISATRADLEAKLELVKHQLVTRLGSLVVIIAGLLFAALHYLPPGR